MADETITGAKTELTVDNEKFLTEKRKKMIKNIIIFVVVAVAAWYIYKKFIK